MNFEADFLSRQYFNNSLGEWLLALSLLIITVLAARVAYLIISKVLKVFTSRTATKLDDLLLEKLETPAIFSIILIGVNLSISHLHFTQKVDLYIHRAFVFLTTLSLTWLAVRAVHAFIEEYVRPYSMRSTNRMNEQMVMLLERAAGIILWSVGVIAGLNNAGFDVGALIAGLGIGGLALALAAQDTVKNIFGGVMIFLDQPFKLTDRIKIGEYDGFVEYIGIRSTRLKTLEGRIVTIPNAQFSDSPIENVTIEPSRKVENTLGLVYETHPDKVEEAMDILRSVSEEAGTVNHAETVVFFEKFSNFSLDIKFVYFIKKEAEIFKATNDINLQVLRRFNAAGIAFAYPTQTIYHEPVKK